MAVDTISLFVETLHRSGAPVHVIEERVQTLLNEAGLNGAIVASPTAAWLSVETQTRILRIDPQEPDLERLAALHGWHARHAAQPHRREAARDLRDIAGREPRWPWPLEVAMFALSSGSAGALMGQSWMDVLGGGVGGLAVWATLAWMDSARFKSLSMLGVGLVGGLVGISCGEGGGIPEAIALSSVVVVLPGLGLTTSLTEVASGHWSAGSARLLGAVASATQLSVGLAIAAALPTWSVLSPVGMDSGAVPTWWVPVVAPSAFAILLRAHPAHLPVITVLAASGFGLAQGIGGPVGAGVAAFVVGLGANGLARTRGVPALVTLVPGILLLVPGSVGVRGVTALLAKESMLGVEIGLEAVTLAGALALGVLAAQAVMPVAGGTRRQLGTGWVSGRAPVSETSEPATRTCRRRACQTRVCRDAH